MDYKEMQAHEKLYRELETRVRREVKRITADSNDPDRANRVGLNAAIHLLAYVLGGVVWSANQQDRTPQDHASLADHKIHELVDGTLRAAGIDMNEGAPFCPHRN